MEKPNVNAAGYERDIRVLAKYSQEECFFTVAALASELEEIANGYNISLCLIWKDFAEVFNDDGSE